MVDGGRVSVWLRPTRRAIDWTPLLMMTAALLTSAVVLRWRSVDVPATFQYLAVAGLGAAAVLALGDPARGLLQALPTRPIVRLAHRASLIAVTTSLVAVALFATLVLGATRSTLEPGLAAALLALVATGTAVHATLDSNIDHAQEVAAGSILLWVGAGTIEITFVPDGLWLAWLEHPWPVTVAAVALTVAVTARW